MNDIERQLKQLGTMKKHTKLSDKERVNIRARLLSHMAEHPISVRVDEPIRHQVIAVINRFTRKFFKKPMIIGLIIALVFGGGTAFAAEATIPGDVLYPVKVHVNEQVRSALAISDEAEARLQTDLAAERLKEAEALASHHKLDETTRVQLEKEFSAHASDADVHVEQLKEKKGKDRADLLQANLDAMLRTHAHLLEEIDGDEPTEREVGALVNRVHAELKTSHHHNHDDGHGVATSSTASGTEAVEGDDDQDTRFNINERSDAELHGDSSGGENEKGDHKDNVHIRTGIDAEVHTENGDDTDVRVRGDDGVHIGL